MSLGRFAARGLPDEGAITNVELALRAFGGPLPVCISYREPIKVRASLSDIVMADIMVKVFPKPMSSASMPPLEGSGFVRFLDPRIAC